MRALLVAVLSLTVLLSMPTGEARAQEGLQPDDVRLELALEDRAHPPHVGEMILLSIQGTYRVPVIREALSQPPLDGFDWMQLGEDRWYKAREDGFEVVKMERRMALFPLRPGPIDIAPFTHGLEMLSRSGATVKLDAVSGGVTVEAVPAPESDTWWFPLRRIEINDSWSNAPEALDPGGAALRIVTLTVEGAEPQRIPPMPEMTGAGLYIFAHPPQLITALGPRGPLTRVFWRWTVRPEEGSAGYLNPIPLAWFDAETRETRTVMLAAQRVAHADGPQEVRGAAPAPRTSGPVADTSGGTALPPLPGWALPLALLVGLLGGLAAMIGGNGRALRTPAGIIRLREAWSLRLAAWRRDAPALRNAAHRALAQHGGATPAELDALDRALYGGGTLPDLGAVARAVRAASRPPT